METAAAACQAEGLRIREKNFIMWYTFIFYYRVLGFKKKIGGARTNQIALAGLGSMTNKKNSCWVVFLKTIETTRIQWSVRLLRNSLTRVPARVGFFCFSIYFQKLHRYFTISRLLVLDVLKLNS